MNHIYLSKIKSKLLVASSELNQIFNCINNMKTITILFLLSASLVFSQSQKYPDHFSNNHNNINKNGMLVLGAWASANIISGSIAMTNSGGEAKFFNQFNVLWNSVNLTIAAIGYFNSTNAPAQYSLQSDFYNYNSISNILLFNSGLDVAYIISGFYLKERAKNSDNKELYTGYGNSLIVQGSFLLIFDLALYYLHLNNANVNLFPYFESDLQTQTNSYGISVQIRI